MNPTSPRCNRAGCLIGQGTWRGLPPPECTHWPRRGPQGSGPPTVVERCQQWWTNSWLELSRGEAWCGQQQWTVAYLALCDSGVSDRGRVRALPRVCAWNVWMDLEMSVVGQNPRVPEVCGTLQKRGLEKMKGVWRAEVWQDFSIRVVRRFGCQGRALGIMTQNPLPKRNSDEENSSSAQQHWGHWIWM